MHIHKVYHLQSLRLTPQCLHFTSYVINCGQSVKMTHDYNYCTNVFSVQIVTFTLNFSVVNLGLSEYVLSLDVEPK